MLLAFELPGGMAPSHSAFLSSASCINNNKYFFNFQFVSNTLSFLHFCPTQPARFPFFPSAFLLSWSFHPLSSVSFAPCLTPAIVHPSLSEAHQSKSVKCFRLLPKGRQGRMGECSRGGGAFGCSQTDKRSFFYFHLYRTECIGMALLEMHFLKSSKPIL